MSNTSVAVLGLGYVGCVTAACLADLGHDVVGVDCDERKCKAILDGRAPFFEPGLEELIGKNVQAHRLGATPDTGAALSEAGIAIICVGTPSKPNGDIGLDQLRRVAGDIAEATRHRSRPLVICVRSTLFPGTSEAVFDFALRDSGPLTLVYNPEFLREGAAVRDFMEPAIVVIGGEEPASVDQVARLYAPLGVPASRVSLRCAEMIKYACNAFHGMKIGFANEVGALCSRVGVSGEEVMEILCRDRKLNVAPAYLRPGFAFGGSCLPKDMRALTYRAAHLDLTLPLLGSVLQSNHEHLNRATGAVLGLRQERLGFYGLAFKEGTDDLRESPVVAMLERLIGKGRSVRIFDPHVALQEVHGSNRSFVLSALPHIGKLMKGELAQVLDWADHLVIAQKPSPAHDEMIRSSGVPVLDLNCIGQWERPTGSGTAVTQAA